MKKAIAFACLSVVLLVSAGFNEWGLPKIEKPTVKYKKAPPYTVHKYERQTAPPPRTGAGGKPDYDMGPESIKPMRPHYGLEKEPKLGVGLPSKPIHERGWFVITKEWFGLLANFIQTIGGLFSGVVAIVLWRRNRKLETAKT